MRIKYFLTRINFEINLLHRLQERTKIVYIGPSAISAKLKVAFLIAPGGKAGEIKKMTVFKNVIFVLKLSFNKFIHKM